MTAVATALIAAVAALITWRARRRAGLPGRAMIISPPRSTVISGDRGVRSVQSAELTMSRNDLDRLWNAKNLENLARTYWEFLSKVTLGLVRVRYGEDERRVTLLGLVTLLRFDTPEYTVEPDHGNVTWQIRDGLLVAKPGRGSGGFLALDVRREGESRVARYRPRIHIDVEVANFYPSIAAGFSTPVYQFTQSVIHVLVTNAFLRSLATLELAESRIGSLAVSPAGPDVEQGGSQNGTEPEPDVPDGADAKAAAPEDAPAGDQP